MGDKQHTKKHEWHAHPRLGGVYKDAAAHPNTALRDHAWPAPINTYKCVQPTQIYQYVPTYRLCVLRRISQPTVRVEKMHSVLKSASHLIAHVGPASSRSRLKDMEPATKGNDRMVVITSLISSADIHPGMRSIGFR